MPHCKRNDGRKPAAAGSAEEADPMGLGMAMGKKMMDQGRGPMAMRQRMMAQTSCLPSF